MIDQNNSGPSFLEILLDSTPDQALISLLVELHRRFSPLETALEILMNHELEEKDSDQLFEIMEQNSIYMHELLETMRDYVKARQAMNNTDSLSSDYPYI